MHYVLYAAFSCIRFGHTGRIINGDARLLGFLVPAIAKFPVDNMFGTFDKTRKRTEEVQGFNFFYIRKKAKSGNSSIAHQTAKPFA